MPNLSVIYDITIAVTWDEINTNKQVTYQPTCLGQVSLHLTRPSSIYGLVLLVLEGKGGKTLATDHRVA